MSIYTHQLKIALTFEQMEYIMRRAHEHGMPHTTWARSWLLNDFKPTSPPPKPHLVDPGVADSEFDDPFENVPGVTLQEKQQALAALKRMDGDLEGYCRRLAGVPPEERTRLLKALSKY